MRGLGKNQELNKELREGGLEPPHLTAPDPKSGVSAISPPPHRDRLEAVVFRALMTYFRTFLAKRGIFYVVCGFINRRGAYIIRRLVARMTNGRYYFNGITLTKVPEVAGCHYGHQFRAAPVSGVKKEDNSEFTWIFKFQFKTLMRSPSSFQ